MEQRHWIHDQSISEKAKVKLFPNLADNSLPHATWKWKDMFRKMVIPGERIAEGESEVTGDTGSVETYPDTASI